MFQFLSAIRGIRHKGLHGKLYDLWTIPETPWLPTEESSRLFQILGDIEEGMKDALKNGKIKRLPFAKESTSSGSSVAAQYSNWTILTPCLSSWSTLKLNVKRSCLEIERQASLKAQVSGHVVGSRKPR